MEKSNSKSSFFHFIHCEPMNELRISLSNKGKSNTNLFSVIGVSSKEKLKKGLKLVESSPFQTIFVISSETGKVLYAISTNKEYIKSAKKRKKKPKDPPQLPPDPTFCYECFKNGGKWCEPNLKICSHEWSKNRTPNLNDPLEDFAPI